MWNKLERDIIPAANYMYHVLRYLNPIEHLGDKRYSLVFPLMANILLCLLSEFYAFNIVNDPMSVGAYIIFLNTAFIIYFAFREGVRGGVTSTVVSIGYYVYIIYSRNYSGSQLRAGVYTTVLLGMLFLLLGGIIGWLKETIDILIDRQADEKKRLQSIVQQLPVGVIIADSEGRVTQVNKLAQSILDTKIPLGSLIGEDTIIEASQNGKTVPSTRFPFAQMLTTGKPVAGKEYTFQRSDGKEAHVQVNASVIHNRNGKIIAAASIIHDVTQKIEMEKRKDDFVNMASHELKTPLTSLKLYLDVLIRRRKKLNDEKMGKMLDSIKYQTDRLQELVSGLLDVSRLQTGKLGFAKENFRIDTLIEETIEELQDVAGQKITLTKKKALNVYADRFRIYQVATNLITNAIKYSPQESGISVRVMKKNGRAVVSVTDQGIGIEKDEQKKIFDRLYQVTGSHEKTFPGLGMGLYISKEIIKRHQGRLWVESIKQKGSTFSFSLPLKKKKA